MIEPPQLEVSRGVGRREVEQAGAVRRPGRRRAQAPVDKHPGSAGDAIDQWDDLELGCLGVGGADDCELAAVRANRRFPAVISLGGEIHRGGSRFGDGGDARDDL